MLQVATAVSNYETMIVIEFTQDNNSDQHLEECVVNSGAELREQHQIQSVEKDKVLCIVLQTLIGIHIWQVATAISNYKTMIVTEFTQVKWYLNSCL